MSATEIAGITLGIVGFVFALYRWSVSRSDKRRQERNDLQDKTLQEHAQRLNRHSERLSKMDEMIKITREEMHQHYPRLERIEGLEKTIDDKLERVHSRLTGISKDLNQAIGSMRANHENEITNLVEQIRTAIERTHD